MANQGNVDIQYLAENTCALNRYLTSYISKAERGSIMNVIARLMNPEDFKSALLHYGHDVLKNRHVSIQESVCKLLGIPLCGLSTQVFNLKIGLPDEIYRKIKDPKDI